MKESYKESASKTKVPSHLLISTAEKMKSALELPPEDIQLTFPEVLETKQKKRKVLPFALAITGIAAALLLFLPPSLAKKPAVQIITPLVAGVHENQVDLSEGALHFVGPEELTFHRAPLFGSPTHPIFWSRDDYQTFIGRTPLPPADILNFTLEKETIRVIEDSEGNIASNALFRRYQGEQDAEITVEVSKTAQHTSEYIAENFTSHLGTMPLRLRWDEHRNRYTAEYQTKDYSLTCTAMGVSQEDFIEILIGFLK